MIKVTESTITPGHMVAVSTRANSTGVITVQAGNGYDGQLYIEKSTRAHLTMEDAADLMQALYDLGVKPPTLKEDNPQVWIQDLDEDNLADLGGSMRDASNQLRGIVDEEQGGIIAYALSEETAQRIAHALNVV